MNKLVVHSAVGRILKGNANDFSPMKPTFHLKCIDPPGQLIEISLRNLKAVFFVKNFSGDPSHNDAKDFSRAKFPGKKIRITFSDGEVFHGISDVIHAKRTGFFIFPADPEANTIRAFVINDSITSIEECD